VRVEATIGGETFRQLREINTGDGISGNALDAHFGLGDATRAETLQIRWPSGIVQELRNVSANQILTVTEPTRLELTVSRSSELVELSVKSWEGFVYQIEASSDFKVWTPLGTLTNSSGTLQFADPLPTDVALRFYRVRSE
jgi:hypothetical protein